MAFDPISLGAIVLKIYLAVKNNDGGEPDGVGIDL